MSFLSIKKPEVADLSASLVVFLVALPLSIGIAVASGAPVHAGLVSAMIGGVVVGLVGGAPMQVSGPAAGLIVMVAGYIGQFSLASFGIAVAGAGILQMVAGFSGVSRAALAMAPALLHAMLAGIGVVIAIGQLQTFLGFAPASKALENLKALPDHLMHANMGAVIVGGTALVVLILWNQFLASRIKAIPGALVAIASGALVARFFVNDVKFVRVPPFGDFHLPSLGDNSIVSFAGAALALFIVASAESLLCAVATDQMHKGERANLDRELFAQGLGNFLAGVFSCLPITGVIVRSTANIASGARTQWSAILHGVWMMVFALLFAPFLEYIPMPALAALLICVGVKLVKMQHLRQAINFKEGHIYIATIIGIIFINLLWGIGIGFILSVLTHLVRGQGFEWRADVQSERVGDHVHVNVHGRPNFLTVPSLTRALNQASASASPSASGAAKGVKLNIHSTFLDHSVVETIESWKKSLRNIGVDVHGDDAAHVWRSRQGEKVVVPKSDGSAH